MHGARGMAGKAWAYNRHVTSSLANLGSERCRPAHPVAGMGEPEFEDAILGSLFFGGHQDASSRPSPVNVLRRLGPKRVDPCYGGSC